MCVLFYVSPLALMLLPAFTKKLGILKSCLIIGVNSLLLIPIIIDVPLFYGNVFTNMSLGPETFYDNKAGHLYSKAFGEFMNVLKIILVICSSSVVSMYFLTERIIFSKIKEIQPFQVFLLMVGIGYICSLSITESFFDRYLLPLITLIIIFFSFFVSMLKPKLWLLLPILVLMIYAAVLGTKDYFNMNRAKWKAVDILKNEKSALLQKINAGFEVNCWNDGKYSWFVDYTTLENFDYLIQYSNQTEFTLYKEIEFQRYFPYKKDKINIFVRDSLKK